MSGKRWSTQVSTPLKGPAPVTGSFFSVAAMSGPLARVFADHHDVRALVAVGRDLEVDGRGRALHHAAGQVEARAVARAEVAAGPVRAHVRGRADLLLEVRRAAQVGA